MLCRGVWNGSKPAWSVSTKPYERRLSNRLPTDLSRLISNPRERVAGAESRADLRFRFRRDEVAPARPVGIAGRRAAARDGERRHVPARPRVEAHESRPQAVRHVEHEARDDRVLRVGVEAVEADAGVEDELAEVEAILQEQADLPRVGICMRTTIRLPEDLLDAAKRRAIDTGRTLTKVIEDALRAALAREATGPDAGDVTLPTFGSGGLRPRVDLDDSACLLDAMEDVS